MTKFGKWKVKTPTSENHRGFRVLSIWSWCHAKPFIPKSVLCNFYLFLFCGTPFVKTIYQQFYFFFLLFMKKRKVKRRKRKKPWRNHQALFSCQRYVVPASIKSNCITPQQYGRTNVQKLSPTPQRPNNKLRVLFDIVSLRPRPNVQLFMRRSKLYLGRP